MEKRIFPHAPDCPLAEPVLIEYLGIIDGRKTFKRGPVPFEMCNCHVTAMEELEKELVDLKQQKVFELAFADKLKEFGTIDRLVEEYSAMKMALRETQQAALNQIASSEAYKETLFQEKALIGANLALAEMALRTVIKGGNQNSALGHLRMAINAALDYFGKKRKQLQP